MRISKSKFVKLISIKASTVSIGISSIGTNLQIPAELTTTSIRPNFSTTKPLIFQSSYNQ